MLTVAHCTQAAVSNQVMGLREPVCVVGAQSWEARDTLPIPREPPRNLVAMEAGGRISILGMGCYLMHNWACSRGMELGHHSVVAARAPLET